MSNERVQDVMHILSFCSQFKPPAILSSLGTTRAVSLAAKPIKQSRVSAKHQEKLSPGSGKLCILLSFVCCDFESEYKLMCKTSRK